MEKYLTIGATVQIFIIVLRWVLGKSRGMIMENKSNAFFWIALLSSVIVNIVLWPIAIVSEIILTKERI